MRSATICPVFCLFLGGPLRQGTLFKSDIISFVFVGFVVSRFFSTNRLFQQKMSLPNRFDLVSYYLPLFCLFLGGRLRRVLLYKSGIISSVFLDNCACFFCRFLIPPPKSTVSTKYVTIKQIGSGQLLCPLFCLFLGGRLRHGLLYKSDIISLVF